MRKNAICVYICMCPYTCPNMKHRNSDKRGNKGKHIDIYTYFVAQHEEGERAPTHCASPYDGVPRAGRCVPSQLSVLSAAIKLNLREL